MCRLPPPAVHPGVRRVPLLVLLVLAATLLPTAAQAGPLSAERFAVLDRVLAALVPLDASSPRKADVTQAMATCGVLGKEDGLVVQQRKACLHGIGFTEDSVAYRKRVATCRTLACMGRATRGYARQARTLVRTLREVDRSTRRRVADGACLRALTTPRADLRALDRLVRALDRLGRATRVGAWSTRRAAAQLDRALLRAGEGRTAKQTLALFRRDCR